MQNSKEIKEPFCSACVAGLAALTGAGAASQSKKSKDVIFWGGVALSVISIIILIYLILKPCKECK